MRSVEEILQSVSEYRKLAVSSPVEYEPELALELSNLACHHYSSKQYAIAKEEALEAIAIYEHCIEQSSISRYAMTISLIYQKCAACIVEDKGDLNEAEKYLRKSIEYCPNEYNAYLALGKLLIEMNRAMEAVKAWEKAMESEPDITLMGEVRELYDALKAHGLVDYEISPESYFRREQIADYIEYKEQVNIDEVSKELSIDRSTVMSDINLLRRIGRIALIFMFVVICTLFASCKRTQGTQMTDESPNSLFNAKNFVEFIKSDTSTISNTFSELIKTGDIEISTSDDGNLRIYSWDDKANTARFSGIKYICQYRVGNTVVLTTDSLLNIVTNKEKTNAPLLDNINAVKVVGTAKDHKGRNIYILEFYERADTQYGCRLLVTFVVSDGSLHEYNAFEDGKSYEYFTYGSIADWYFRTDGMGWDWIDSYDSKTMSLYIPDVTEEESLSDRYKVYQFDGTRFRYDRTDGGFWIHPSLRSFTGLATVFQTKDYIVRVDLLGQETYRYTSWKRGKTMLDKPDIVIKGSSYDAKNRCFIFNHKDESKGLFQYVVYMDLGFDSPKYRLVVMNNKRTVLQQ